MNNDAAPSTKFQLRIPQSLKDTIEREAAKRTTTASMLVRLAVVQYLELPNADARFKEPIPTQVKTKRANDKRRMALKALKHLQRTNPLLLQEIAEKMKEGAA